MSDLGTGLGYFIRGFELIRRRRALPYVIAPVIVNLLVLVPAVYFALEWADAALAALDGWLPDWLGFLMYVARPVTYVFVFVSVVVLGSFTGTIIGAPFLGPLSAQIERELGGDGPRDETPWLSMIPRALVREMRKLAYHAPRYVGVLILTFIPLFSPFAPLLWFAITAWLLAVEYVDFPIDNRGRAFDELKSALASRRGLAFGFGIGAAFALSIPLFNIVAIPAATAGGTALWIEELAG
jgi:CysZ protein